MVVSSVNDRNLDRKTGDPPRGGKTPKTRSHDYHAQFWLALHPLFRFQQPRFRRKLLMPQRTY
jgi:hypothetical protein